MQIIYFINELKALYKLYDKYQQEKARTGIERLIKKYEYEIEERFAKLRNYITENQIQVNNKSLTKLLGEYRNPKWWRFEFFKKIEIPEWMKEGLKELEWRYCSSVETNKFREDMKEAKPENRPGIILDFLQDKTNWKGLAEFLWGRLLVEENLFTVIPEEEKNEELSHRR